MDLIGKQLPSVSASDNGKVLGVENGAWRPIMPTPASPADMVFIPYQSLTYSSITDALAAGQTPFTRHTILNEDYTFYLIKNEPSAKYIFCCVTMDPYNGQLFQMHFLQVTSSNLKVTATELFYDREVVDTLQGDVQELYKIVRLKQLPLTVSGKTATLDLTSKGGIQSFMQEYAAGNNIQFIGLNIQSSPDNILIFAVCGIDTATTNLHVDLSCVSEGKAYYVRLTPVDTNVMRGTLYTYTLQAIN